MALDKKDLESIRSIVSDVVETKIEENNEKIFKKVETKFEENNEKIFKKVDDIVETKIEKNNEKIYTNVKDIVEFAIEKSKMRTDIKLEKMEERIVTCINREISDIAETTREVLNKLDNHEHRIKKLETKTVRL